jgi:hypothetical protein
MSGNFISQITPILSTLDNLAVLTLRDIPISHLLLQSIGRLQALECLVIAHVRIDDAHLKEPMFGPHETPFPALRQLTIKPGANQVHQAHRDALCIIVSATKLRSVAIEDNRWLRRLLPHITPQLVSLTGNFSDIPSDDFHRFIKGHPALQDLTVYSSKVDNQSFYLDLDLDPDDLPDLRSFSGPFPLVPKVIHTRPVTKLALDCHLPCEDDPTFLPSLYGLTAFPHTHSVLYNIHHACLDMHDVWTDLESVSGDVQDLFVPMGAKATWMPRLGLCFPNLHHLQLDLKFRESRYVCSHYTSLCRLVKICIFQHARLDDAQINELLGDVGKALAHFNSLKSLVLQSRSENAPCWLSPGEQHSFVHDTYQANCPTLETVVFGPLMVWHLRAVPTNAGECHCDLELLSSRVIYDQLRCLVEERSRAVCDWKGKLARLLREGLWGFPEMDMKRLFKHNHK